MDEITLVKAFGAFFAIMNPFVNLPIFLSLTNEFTVSQQRSLTIKIAIYSVMMSAVILFAGRDIINFFGITIDQFRIAGGLVLGHIALSMLNGKSIASHHGSDSEKDSMQELSALAFYPITFPIIVGPGTIATMIIYTGDAKGIGEVMEVGALAAAALALLFAVLYFASFFSKFLTLTLRVIMTRIMGMILLSIAIEMIFAGAKALLPGLA